MDQLNFFDTKLTENLVFDILKDSLLNIIVQNNVAEQKLICKEGKSYSSVWYDTQLVFRVCCRGKHHYFGISDVYKEFLPRDFDRYIIKHKSGFTNYAFEQTREAVLLFAPILCACLDKAIDSVEKEFDCCSRYEECSDMKRCVNPNPDLATGCGYRRIMKTGIIFYGINRNIE